MTTWQSLLAAWSGNSYLLRTEKKMEDEGLSEKAKEHLRRNEELRKKEQQVCEIRTG
jgi:hypothetical protein